MAAVAVEEPVEESRRRRLKLAFKLDLLRQAHQRFSLIEGAMRAGKTWGCLIIVRLALHLFPGIGMVMCRYQEGDLWNKLVPDYKKVCRMLGMSEGVWNAREAKFEFSNGSYLHAMHMLSSRQATQDSKPRGLTVAWVYISQLEEVPYEVAREWMLRLSQPGFPQRFIADANPVHDGHWIATEWPENNSRPNHLYLTISIWENAHNLDRATIEAAEAMYPLGHPQRGAKLEGKRGATSEGAPVYADEYSPQLHDDAALQPWAHAPLAVAWDFGSKHPAVVAGQVLPWGEMRVLGGIMGDGVLLERFAPEVERILCEWFPAFASTHADGRPKIVARHVGDPAGSHRNSQGVTLNAQKALAGLGIALHTNPDSNDLRVRYACVQAVGGFMLRTCQPFVGSPKQGGFRVGAESRPAFRLRPRGVLVSRDRATGKLVHKAVNVLSQALGGGYVWDDTWHGQGPLANIRRPKKDGFFEHVMNCLEYLAHHFAHARPTDKKAEQAAVVANTKAAIEEKVALRQRMRDDHPEDSKPKVAQRQMHTLVPVRARRTFY